MAAVIAEVDAALEYASRGWPVFPCHHPTRRGCSCGRVDCPAPCKHPRTPHGLHDATVDFDRIVAWWERWPWANVGLRTGAPSGLVVLDVDLPAGPASLAALEERIGPLPEGWRVATGSGGRHHWFANPAGIAIRNSAGRLGPGLDLRGDGGYVLAPPSVHASGRAYSWNRNPDIPRIPDDLLALVQPAEIPPRPQTADPMIGERRLSAWAHTAIRGELDRVRHAPPGQRNATLNRAAFVLGQIAGAGAADPDLLHQLLSDAGLAIGLRPTEVDATVRSGLTAGMNRPRHPTDRPTPSTRSRAGGIDPCP